MVVYDCKMYAGDFGCWFCFGYVFPLSQSSVFFSARSNLSISFSSICFCTFDHFMLIPNLVKRLSPLVTRLRRKLLVAEAEVVALSRRLQ